jgi:hypothetical protein
MVTHVYNLTNLTNFSGGMGNLVYQANNATNGFLVGLFLVAIFLVLLFSFMRFGDVVRSIAGASFVCFLLASILVYADFLEIYYALLFLVLVGITTFIMYMEE